MKTISTLIEDIYGLFKDSAIEFPAEAVTELSENISKRIHAKVSEERQPAGLRLSNLGKPCEKELWYSVNAPELAKPLPPEARIKFLFGDILEELLLWLARQAGHTVTDEQKEVNLHGVKGHIDGRVDGVLVDAKSASSYSFDKFNAGLSPDNDSFGYLTQLDSYQHADSDDPRGDQENVGGFLVIDKTLGKICLDTHPKSVVDYKSVIDSKREMLAKATPPPRRYSDEPDGKSGNYKLSVPCSYCAWNAACWPGLRAFAYASGPRYLTRVVRPPDVPEIT